MKRFIKGFVAMMMIPVMAMSSLPVSAQENNQYFDLIDDIIQSEIYYGLSGAQLVVMQGGEIIKESAYGYTTSYESMYDANGEVVMNQAKVIPIEDRNPITNDTLFDLASNTKMYAGNYAIQRLESKGLLSLDDKVQDFFPDFIYRGIGVDGQGDVTIAHLLRHDSGFIASPKYHDNTFTGNLGNGSSTENYLYSQDPATVIDQVLRTPLEFAPGTKVRYSDVDFMLLGKIVEKVTNKSLDQYLKDEIYTPMGVDSVTFNPLDHGFSADQIASTELHGNSRDGRVFFNNYRKEVLTGTVHDEKAYHSFGGVSGHAGLFGDAKDVAKLANLMLTSGESNGKQYFTQETIDQFSQPSPLNDTYGYGWRRQGDSKGYDWAFSPYASTQTLGHTGWTGTITLIDPAEDIVMVLLTNARNSPIMGPDKNDFYTKSFLTNDYGTITTLGYEGLGLGSNESRDTILRGLINKQTANYDKTVSTRNGFRALLDVAKKDALTENKSLELITSDALAPIHERLNETFEADTYHLDVKKSTTSEKDRLHAYIEKVSEVDGLTEEEVRVLEFASIIERDLGSQQLVINKTVERLQTVLDNHKGPETGLDTKSLENLLGQIDGLDTSLFTDESLKPLLDASKEVKVQLETGFASQADVDNAFNNLSELYKGLIYKTTTPSPEVLPEKVLPNTGQSNPIVLLSVGILVGLVGTGIMIMGKKKDNY